ncbi:exodeoxyribonuclease VII large subunit [Temperatibacter marinus]|uniref:Exodeoxyribonuclease 7 large subunit n=1 Tax=Temperatibacter marinus TaxID=1456591 RepID=A0AA52EFI7_9PROT|nr:exodeoxyribonuclease VII large subunit [Temperatibacter marinus]WND01602.1 exodeoxyribonuclease VII large subunit [Temperatibacter marinus]
MDPSENHSKRSNVPELTVSELARALKSTVEDRFGYVRLRAELSGVKRAASGHVYMALKDDQAVIDGVCWRGVASKLSFRPEDGLEVIASGKLTTYPARSKYQMVIEKMEPAGEGALMALLEERKKKLAAEGLFASERKKPIPYLPQTIGVVTSPTGAVIRDIIHRLNDRFPRHVIIWPVLVQGEGAADQVATAIQGFNALPLDQSGLVKRPDLLIIARGGGSIEDLWSFNEEQVVRAISASDIPIISAVGHETDTTLSDYAADLRAPTPTGAAEKAVPVKAELEATIADLGRRLDAQKGRLISDRMDRLLGIARGMPAPRDFLGLPGQRLDDLGDRLPRGLRAVTQEKSSILNRILGGLSHGRLKQSGEYAKGQFTQIDQRLSPAYARSIEKRNDRLTAISRMLESLSHKSVLQRGFAMVSSAEGHLITSVQDLKADELLSLTFKDGSTDVVVSDAESHAVMPTQKKPPPVKPKAKKTQKQAKDERQGSLL